jgi:predicted nucleic acid-binding protein
MKHGLDTDFLVAYEARTHVLFPGAHALLPYLLGTGARLALAPQVLAEFIHVVTDARRIPRPLSVPEAIDRSQGWWLAHEVDQVFPIGLVVGDFLADMQRHRLGRKRVLDTLLAATYRAAGVHSIITNNHADYRILGMQTVGYVNPSGTPPTPGGPGQAGG